MSRRGPITVGAPLEGRRSLRVGRRPPMSDHRHAGAGQDDLEALAISAGRDLELSKFMLRFAHINRCCDRILGEGRPAMSRTILGSAPTVSYTWIGGCSRKCCTW